MQHTVKPGALLIAPPSIPDARFQQAVILITDHDHRGSVGLTLNRATDYQVNDLITPLNVEITWDPQLFWGGPVCQDASFLLHSPDWRLTNYTRSITPNWRLTQHWSMFVHLSDGDEPQHWRVFAGCCAWAPRQLDRELSGVGAWQPHQGWLVIEEPRVAELLQLEPEDMWVWACDCAATETVSSWMA
jgi:putative transcriptional regulator